MKGHRFYPATFAFLEGYAPFFFLVPISTDSESADPEQEDFPG